jgi:hypothetical protein
MGIRKFRLVQREAEVAAINRMLNAQGIDVYELRIVPADLESIFISMLSTPVWRSSAALAEH